MGKFKTAIFVILYLLSISRATEFPFEDGHKHYFTYSAISHVLGLHDLTTIIKFHVLPVNTSEDGSMNLLKLDSFVQHSSQGYVQSNPNHWDLSKSFLFHMTGSGVVSKIYHHPDEEHEVLTIKKLLAGTMSMYKQASSEEEWSYDGWETDHHGRLPHSYTGRRDADGTTFSRRHNSSEHVHRTHEKTINYDNRGFLTSVKSTDTIRLRNKPGPPESVTKDENVVIVATESSEFPSITSTSNDIVKLTARRRFALSKEEDFSGFKEDSPEARKAVPKEQRLKDVDKDLQKLLMCLRSFPDSYAANKTQCVHELRGLYNTLSLGDRLNLTLRHLARCQAGDTACKDVRAVFLDILCGRTDGDSQKLVLKHVLRNTQVTEDEIRTVLYHYINLKEPIQETVDAVEDLCFLGDYRSSHTEELSDQQMRACLTLGGIVQSLSTNGNLSLAEDVVMKLEKKLGMYNHKAIPTIKLKLRHPPGFSSPIVNRGKRSIYEFDKEQHDHIVTKMVLIHSLGNAGMSRSLPHIRSYLEPNKGSSAWRRAAANSLRHFTCNESALALFDILAHDTNQKVHKEAREVYQKHPRVKDLMDEKENLVLSRRYNYHTVTRVKRKVEFFHLEILDGVGFLMTIKAPGLDWSYTIGTKNIGANIGIRLINNLQLKLHPLNSFFKVNVDNEAWIHADVGWIGAHVDIARAKFCYVGNIEYNLNVLKEFDIQHYKDLLNKLKDLSTRIVDDVKGAIDQFKKSTDPDVSKNLFSAFIDFIKSLPDLVVQFVDDFIDLVKKVAHYHADPIIEKVKLIGTRVKAFAEDVKQDALDFYHSIADTVMITLPNVGKMLKEAGNDIVSVFKTFFKSPTQSFSKLEQSVIRVQLAVAMFLEAKNTIAEACMFATGKGPVWMQINDDITVITDDIKDLVSMAKEKVNLVVNTVNTTVHGHLPSLENDGIMGPYDLKNWFHEEVQKMLQQVMVHVAKMRAIADPFFQTYYQIMSLIKDVKEAYETVKIVIQEGKSWIQRLFGSKFHRKFPIVKEAGSCTDAVWPSDAKGRYKTYGVDVKATAGETVVNPVSGVVHVSGQDEVTVVPNDGHFQKYLLVLNNVRPLNGITSRGRLLEAGKPIGKVGHSGCDQTFIHVAMFVRGTDKAVDPTNYFSLYMPMPKWETLCNERSLTILGKTFEVGSMSKYPKIELDDYKAPRFSDMANSVKHFLTETKPSFRPHGIDRPDIKALAASFSGKISPLRDIGDMMMNLKNKIPNIKDVFDINTMTLSNLKNLLKMDVNIVKQLDSLVMAVAERLKEVPVINPVSWSLFQLRTRIGSQKLNITGDRLTMVSTLIRNAIIDCPNLKDAITFEFGHYCTPHHDCQGMTCGVAFTYSQYQKTLQVGIRSCGQAIIFSVMNKTTNIDVNGGHQTFERALIDTIVGGMYVTFHVYPETKNGQVNVTFSGALCAEAFETCLPTVSILKNATFDITQPCTSDVSSNPFVIQVNAMPLRQMLSKVTQLDLDIKKAVGLLNNIREALLNKLLDPNAGEIQVYLEEFEEKTDSCVRKVFPAHPKQMTFFEMSARFMVGPIPMRLGFGAGGVTGHSLELGACFMSMKIKGVVTPGASLKVWGDLSVDIGFAFGGMRLTGYIMQIKFPITGTIGFAKFPLDLGGKLDMELVPLKLVLEAYAKIRLIFKSVTVFRGSIWKYQTRTIKRNILDLTHRGSDTSPPSFAQNAVGPREKRSTGGGGCEVKQLAGRDPSDTAFLLEVTAVDDVSDVKTFYAIGTHEGGADVVGWTQMSGNSFTVPMKLPNGIPLYWTIKAENSGGGEAVTQCRLHTYDNTPPDGRVDDDSRMSSNPFQLGGTVVVLDDSNVDPEQHIALGFCPGGQGHELDPWTPIRLERTTARLEEKTALKYFSLPKIGRLTANPIKSVKTQYDVDCAKQCLARGQNCVSFDFDYRSQTCDFHDVGEGPYAQLHAYGSFKSFERLGAGQKHYKLYKNLNLTHGVTYFINTEVVNELGYKSYLSSHGTLVDLTPPAPGPVWNYSEDSMKADGCKASILQRCTESSGLPNHRLIKDGEGSSTVFNGHKGLNDEKYTLANNFIAGNWDGFHDNETGIYGYTWAAGTNTCTDDIVHFNDPHANLPSKDDWTYTGLTSGLLLKDGPYYVTVQAINNIVYGGALVTTVCHSTPLIVDTTPPVFNGVIDLFFDEDFEILGLYYNGSDALSKIAHVDFGLGHTKYDVGVRQYEEYESFGTSKPYIIIENFKLQQGVPAWPRIRLTNNGTQLSISDTPVVVFAFGLTTSGHGKEPLIVDDSPPEVGLVADGDVFNTDIKYQADGNNICVQWQKFFDSESGIESYLWGVGTSPGTDNTVKYRKEARTVHKDCARATLHHNTTYFSTIIAYNAALNQKNSNMSSDGVLVDLTDPVKGWLKDGNNGTTDMEYSSDQALIPAIWGEFSDPESGISKYEVQIYINDQQRKSNTFPNDVHSMKEKTLELKHGDHVRTNIKAYNGAMRSVGETTNGYLVDLTPPVPYFVHDHDGNTKYQTDKTTLHLSWKFEDKESKMDRYLLTVMKDFHGMKKPVWPAIESAEVLPATGSEMKRTLTGLSLTDGARYYVHVVGINNAKLSESADSSGVYIDSTPPTIEKIHIGPFEEDEEIENGTIIHTDKSKITLSWRASDPQSGISKAYIAIGTSKSDQSVTKGFLTVTGTSEVKLKHLNMEDTDTSKRLYYVQIKVENGAGLDSTILVSKPIKVLPGNVPGIIYDGRKRFKDADYSHDKSTFAMSFAGFKSIACGIVAYEWGIGTEPFVTDVIGFTGFGIVKTNESSGFGQMNIQLFEGVKYYTTVRARTGHKCHEDYIVSTSNGIIVDTQGPTIKAANKMGHVIPDLKSWGVIFQNRTDIIEIIPNVTDTSGVKFTSFCLGSYPSGEDVHQCQQQLDVGIRGLSLTPGSSVFITINAQDNAENTATWESLALISDISPPELENFTCSSEISIAKTEVECSWTRVNEHESHLKAVHLCVGLADKPCNITARESVPLQTRKWKVDLFRVLSGITDQQLFVTVQVENVMERKMIFTREVLIDKTPPTLGRVLIVTDDRLNSTVEGKACQVAQSYVEILVTAFIDIETGIKRCQAGLGSKPGATNIQEFKTIKTDRVTLFGQLSLLPGDQVFATAECQNNAGLSTAATSDPTVISPKPVLTVQDGDGQTDEDYQSGLSTLQGRWKYSDGCPVTKVEWQIMTVSWNKIQDFIPVTGSGHTFYSDELQLTAGVTYINAIQVTDAIGRIHIAFSDGMTVSIEPPHPGNVRDGTGKDVDYQTETTELSANWDVFGTVNSTEATEQVVKYVVAIGDDVRDPDSRSNIYSFQDAKLQTSFTFRNLTLTAKTVTYYITVRAYSKAGSFQEVFSDGIKVGFDFDLKPGTIMLKRYTNSLHTLMVAWSNFYSDIGIRRYSVGVTSTIVHMPNATVECEEILDVATKHKMSLISSENSLEVLHNLTLQQGHSYYVTVIAHDEAGSCRGIYEGPITVDVTPPVAGNVSVEGRKNRKYLFISHSDRVTITWEGFEDKESEIKLFVVVLSATQPCGTGNETVIKTIDVWNETSATIYKLDMAIGMVYTVEVTAINKAGGNTSVKSAPFLIDTSAPMAGTVKVGRDWKKSRYFQKEQTEVVALTGFVHTPKGRECKNTMTLFPQSGNRQHWVPLTKHNPKTLLVDKQYAQIALTYDDALKNIIAGGLTMNLGESIHEGNYTFNLKVAKGHNIITSFHISFGNLSEYISPHIAPMSVNDQVDKNAAASDDVDPSENDCLRNMGIALFFYGESNNSEWRARLCVKDNSKAESKWFNLARDPSEFLYKTDIRLTKKLDGIKTTWKIDIFNEEKNVAGIDGYIFSEMANAIYRVHTLEEYKPPVGDPLHPFFTQAVLSYLSVPDTIDKDCQHGNAFYDGESGLMEIWVGISSNKTLQDNVVPFTRKATYCLPCKGSCTEICDAKCSAKDMPDFSLLQFKIDNLKLDHSEQGSQTSADSSQMISFKAPTYYINVKAVNFANQSTVSQSNAFQVDITPPKFNYMMCVDPVHSLDEPTEYIGTNNSVGAFWDCDEDVSEIEEYVVEIGSAEGRNDVLKATSVELKKKIGLTLTKYEMMNGKKYFLTVTAINSAGLTTKASCNVTVMLGGTPGQINTKPLFLSKYTASTKVPLTSFQDIIGVDIQGSAHLLYYEWKAGTKPLADDIFPNIQVATQSNKIQLSIQMGRVFVNNKLSNLSLSDYNDNNTQPVKSGLDDDTTLLLEPGRCFYQSVRAVGRSHLSSETQAQPMCIKRDNDVLAEVKSTLQTVQIGNSGVSNGPLSLSFRGYNGSMIIGALSRGDTSKLYGSSASADFLPYITDPEDRLLATSRELIGRLEKYTGMSFFISPTTQALLDDSLFITPKTSVPLQNANGNQIDLLSWNKDEEKWEVSCSTGTTSGTSKFKICPRGEKTKIGNNEYIAITEPQHFALFEINTDIHNTVPVILTKSMVAYEDQAITEYIKVEDKENDHIQLSFITKSLHGNSFLSSDMNLTYVPAPDYCGTDLITVQAVEDHLPPGGKTTPVVQDIKIDVLCVDEPPDLVFFSAKYDVYEAEAYDTIKVELTSPSSSRQKYIVGYVALSDRDAGELVLLFNYNAAKENGFEVKKASLQSNQFHGLTLTGKVNNVYEVWIDPTAGSRLQTTKSIRFRAKDPSSLYSNAMSVNITSTRGYCIGQSCGVEKTEGVKRDMSKLFQERFRAPSPEMFMRGVMGKGHISISTSNSTSVTFMLTTDGVFTKTLDRAKSDDGHLVFKVSGKLSMSAETNNPSSNFKTEADLTKRLIQKFGFPFTVSFRTKDITVSRIDVKVKSVVDNTTVVGMLVKETDGIWREIPPVCTNTKLGLLDADQRIITMCPALFADLSKHVQTIDGTLTADVILYTVKKGKPPNHRPILVSKVIDVLENHQLHVKLHAIDPEGDNFTFHMTKNAEHGHADLDSQGNMVYTPYTHYSGEDTIGIQLNETKVIDGTTPKATSDVLFIDVTAVNDPPMLYYILPHGGQFKIENGSKIEVNLVRPMPYTSVIAELGYMAVVDWDVDDDFNQDVIPLNKTVHDLFQTQEIAEIDSISLFRQPDIKQTSVKKAYRVSMHFLSERTGRIVYLVKVKDNGGAEVVMHMYVDVSFKTCHSQTICTHRVTVKKLN